MFLVLFLCFFFYKIREQEGRTGSAGWEFAPLGGRKWWGKLYEDEYGIKNVYTSCKYKNDTC
jgi:hypothetical protein